MSTSNQLSQAFATAAAWLSQQQAEMLELVQTWSKINSGSYNLDGLAKQHAALVQAFSPLPAELSSVPSAKTTVVNDHGELVAQQSGEIIHLTANPKAERQVLLVGHMDTVFPVDSPFQKPVALSANKINGPGVADMKGGLVVILYALRALAKSSLADNIGWQVVINADEEIGSFGSAEVLATAAGQAKLGLVFEPSVDERGTLAGARKGSGKFCAVARGTSAHAGRDFAKGRNAISALAEWIIEVHALNGQREGLTINIGLVNGGTALNVVPDLAVARIDIRTNIEDDERWVSDALNALTQHVEQKHGVKIELHGHFGRKPKPMHGETAAVFHWVRELAGDLGLDLTWKATGGCCDGNNLAAAGLPTVDTLGVRGGNIHSDQEYMCCDSLVERATLATKLIMEYAAGNDWGGS